MHPFQFCEGDRGDAGPQGLVGPQGDMGPKGESTVLTCPFIYLANYKPNPNPQIRFSTLLIGDQGDQGA